MATTLFVEPGGGATDGLHFWNTSTGTVAVDAVDKPFGRSSLSLTSNTGSQSSVSVSSITGLSRRLSFFVKMPGFADTSDYRLVAWRSAITNPVWEIAVDGFGSLSLYSGASVLVSDFATVAVDQWVRLTVSYNITTTANWSLNVYADGLLIGSFTQADGSLATTLSSSFVFGIIQPAPTSGKVFRFAGIYIDNGTDLADPGNIQVVAKLPNANSTNNFGTGVGASPSNRWENVNERPISETNGWLQAGDEQNASPASDITVGSWTRTGGDGSTLWSCIDEATENDTDFISSPSASTNLCEVKLGAISAPSGDTVTYSYSAWATGGSGVAEKITVSLYEGATLRHTGFQQNLPRSPATVFIETLTTAERNAITDWTNLRVRITPASLGAGEKANVGWAKLTGPGASATNAVENYEIQDAATGDVDLTGATIVARCAWAWAKKSSAAASSGGALYNNGSAVAIILTISSALYTNIVDDSTYPSTAGTVGLRAIHGSPDTTLYECGMLIAYIPAVGGGGTSTAVFYRHLQMQGIA